LGERLWDAVILPESSLADKSLGDSNIGERSGVTVIAINRGASTIFAPPSTYKLQSRDVLVLVGREDRVLPLSEEGLKITREEETEHVSPRGVTMQELLLAPHSTAEGKTLKELNFRQYYGFTAIALWRKGRSYRTEVGNFPLEFGDSLLVVGPPTHIRRLKKDPNFIVLESSLSDQPVYRAQATRAGIVTLGAILMSILGVPVFLSMLAGAAFLILTRSISMEEAYTAVEWPAIFLVAAMYSVSLGMVQTGLADILGTAMVNLASPFGPLGLAAGAYLLTSLLTQFMGGQVTALVTGPIAITAAISMGTNPQAIAVATAIGCSASFLLPISHPVNILMIAPANYRIVDFLRSGLPLTLISFAGLIAGMILFWRL
jgi:di/tricarboxylate transporter